MVTRDSLSTVDYWQMESKDWFLIQTNYNHWETPPFFNDKETPAKYCMNEIGSRVS